MHKLLLIKKILFCLALTIFVLGSAYAKEYPVAKYINGVKHLCIDEDCCFDKEGWYVLGNTTDMIMYTEVDFNTLKGIIRKTGNNRYVIRNKLLVSNVKTYDSIKTAITHTEYDLRKKLKRDLEVYLYNIDRVLIDRIRTPFKWEKIEPTTFDDLVSQVIINSK